MRVLRQNRCKRRRQYLPGNNRKNEIEWRSSNERAVIKRVQRKFGSEGDIRSYFAPGRVNLIGEHTDYNGGHVFPCALTIGTYAIVRKREDRNFRFILQTLRVLV